MIIQANFATEQHWQICLKGSVEACGHAT